MVADFAAPHLIRYMFAVPRTSLRLVFAVCVNTRMVHGLACAFHSRCMFHRPLNVRYSFARYVGRVSNTLTGSSLCLLLDTRAIACYDGRMSKLVEVIRAIGVLHLGGAVIDCARLADTMDKNGWTGTPEELAEVNRRLELSHLALVELTKDAPHD